MGFSTVELHRALESSWAWDICVHWGWTVSAEIGRAALRGLYPAVSDLLGDRLRGARQRLPCS